MRYRNIREASGFYKDVELHQQEFWQCYRNKCWPLYPHATEETRRRSAYTFGETNSPYGLLIALRAGKLEFLVESGKFLMKPGKILVIPPGSRYRFQSPAGNLYHKCVLMIKGVNLFSILETLDLHHPVCLESRETTALFLEKFDRMKNSRTAGEQPRGTRSNRSARPGIPSESLRHEPRVQEEIRVHAQGVSGNLPHCSGEISVIPERSFSEGDRLSAGILQRVLFFRGVSAFHRSTSPRLEPPGRSGSGALHLRTVVTLPLSSAEPFLWKTRRD